MAILVLGLGGQLPKPSAIAIVERLTVSLRQSIIPDHLLGRGNSV